MKNLKTTVFSVAIFGTTFVALSYFCKLCDTDHRHLMDCPHYNCNASEVSDAIFKEYVDILVKDEIKCCCDVGEVNRIIDGAKSLLDIKEQEVRYSKILRYLNTQERIEEFRKSLEDVSKAMINHSVNKDCGFCFDDEILNWSEVFGSDCETAPNSPNHRDGSNENSNEPDQWDSGYTRILPGC